VVDKDKLWKKETTECPKCKDKRIDIPVKIWGTLMTILSTEDKEFAAYLRAKKGDETDEVIQVTDILIPEQVKHAASVDLKEHPKDKRAYGIVHTHPFSKDSVSFSGADDESINKNNRFSIVMSKTGNYEAVTRTILPCGEVSINTAKVVVTYPTVKKAMEEFKKKALDAPPEPKHRKKRKVQPTLRKTCSNCHQWEEHDVTDTDMCTKCRMRERKFHSGRSKLSKSDKKRIRELIGRRKDDEARWWRNCSGCNLETNDLRISVCPLCGKAMGFCKIGADGEEVEVETGLEDAREMREVVDVKPGAAGRAWDNFAGGTSLEPTRTSKVCIMCGEETDWFTLCEHCGAPLRLGVTSGR
jgi:hypothetical protein